MSGFAGRVSLGSSPFKSIPLPRPANPPNFRLASPRSCERRHREDRREGVVAGLFLLHNQARHRAASRVKEAHWLAHPSRQRHERKD